MMRSNEEDIASQVTVSVTRSALQYTQRAKETLAYFLHNEQNVAYASPVHVAQIKDLHRDIEVIEHRLAELQKESRRNVRKGEKGIHTPLARR